MQAPDDGHLAVEQEHLGGGPAAVDRHASTERAAVRPLDGNVEVHEVQQRRTGRVGERVGDQRGRDADDDAGRDELRERVAREVALNNGNVRPDLYTALFTALDRHARARDRAPIAVAFQEANESVQEYPVSRTIDDDSVPEDVVEDVVDTHFDLGSFSALTLLLLLLPEERAPVYALFPASRPVDLEHDGLDADFPGPGRGEDVVRSAALGLPGRRLGAGFDFDRNVLDNEVLVRFAVRQPMDLQYEFEGIEELHPDDADVDREAPALGVDDPLVRDVEKDRVDRLQELVERRIRQEIDQLLRRNERPNLPLRG